MMQKFMKVICLLIFVPSFAVSACIDLKDFRIYRDHFVDLRTGLTWNRCPVNYEVETVNNETVCNAQLSPDLMGFENYGQALAAGTSKIALNSYRPVSEKELLTVMDFCTNESRYLITALFPRLVPFPTSFMVTSNGTRLFYNRRTTPFYAESLVNEVLDLTNVIYTVAD